MNARERIEATLWHRPHDRIPLVCLEPVMPRGDLELSLRQGGMGLVLPREVVWLEYPHVQLDQQTTGDIATTLYHTPSGTLRQRRRLNLGRLPDSACATLDGLIAGVADYEAAAFVLQDAVYHVDASTYNDTALEIGADGVVRCQGPRPAYEVSLELYGAYPGAVQARRAQALWAAEQERFPREFERLLEAAERQQYRCMEAAAASPVPWIALGRIDGMPSAERLAARVLPFYRQAVPRLKAAGKVTSLHAHAGNLRSFVDLIGESGVDIVEGLTPAPGGDLSLGEARRAWGADVVVWLNLPDAVLWWAPDEIRRYVLDLVASDAHPGALMVGLTETGLLAIVDNESDAAYRRGLEAVRCALEEVGTPTA